MKLKKIMTTLLCTSLCLTFTACGSANSANTTSSSGNASGSEASVALAGHTEITADLDDKGKEILSVIYCPWVSSVTLSEDAETDRIILSENGALIYDNAMDLNILSYTNSDDEYYEFNMEAVPNTDGTCYKIYLMYMPEAGDYSADEFYMYVDEAEYKNGEVVENSETGMPKVFITEAAYERLLEEKKEMLESGEVLPRQSESDPAAEVAEVHYYYLDQLEYLDGTVKKAGETDELYAFSVKPAYPEYIVGLKEGLPNTFEIKEEDGATSVLMEIPNDKVTEETVTVYCPITIDDEKIVIDMSDSGSDLKTIQLKRVEQDEFYSDSLAMFYGMFE